MDPLGFVFVLNTHLDPIGFFLGLRMPVATPAPMPVVVANVSFHRMELHSSRIAIFDCPLCGLAMASSYDDGSPLIAVAASALANNSDAATRSVAMLLVILLERDSGAAIGSDDDDDDDNDGVFSIARPRRSAALLTRPRAATERASSPLDSMWNSPCLLVILWSL